MFWEVQRWTLVGAWQASNLQAKFVLNAKIHKRLSQTSLTLNVRIADNALEFKAPKHGPPQFAQLLTIHSALPVIPASSVVRLFRVLALNTTMQYVPIAPSVTRLNSSAHIVRLITIQSALI